MVTKEDIDAVVAKHPLLELGGFRHRTDKPDPRGISPDAVQKCIEFLLRHDALDRRKTVNTRMSSYGWKHVVERYYNKQPNKTAHTYIANGDFICAALILGYKMLYDWRSHPNAYFNMRIYKEDL